tara:strand:+ start:1096 stop:2082 length:987 start_codon:yes stop_codon:yes gene_type:complete
MSKILIIDPGKGWGHFVSKMYCYQKLAESLNSKIIFLTKKSTQAKHYLKLSSFCEEVIYLDEPQKGLKNIFQNIKSFFNNISIINKLNFERCFVFHPSLRYLLIAKFSKAKNIWGLGLRFQNFFLKKNKKLYLSFFSKTIQDDYEALEFVKKIASLKHINFKPLYSTKVDFRDTVGVIIAASGNEKRWSIKNYVKVINYLIDKNYKKFLIISGIDQLKEELLIKEKFSDKIEMIFSSNKNISDVIPYLKKCKFCVGNDTGFSHLSINLNIETVIIHGDCPPQSYSDLISHIDIDEDVTRSATSINTITVEKALTKLSNFLHGRDGRVV